MPRKPKKTKPIEAAIEAQAAAVDAMPVAAETPLATEPLIEQPAPALVSETPTATVIPWTAKIPFGPTWETTFNLGTRNDAPKMRLGRHPKFRQMTMHFEEKPTEEVRQRLHEAEWTWRKADGYWTKQLEFGQEKQGHETAERFFFELADLERQARCVESSQAASR